MASQSRQLRDRDVDALLSAIDDYRAVIAAGKVQRWDVVKWVVLINLGFATASVTPLQRPGLFAGLACVVAVIGIALVIHYNTRMTGARRAVEKLEDRIAADCIDVREIAVEERDQKTAWYDTLELLVFPAAIALSAAPSVVLNFFKAE